MNKILRVSPVVFKSTPVKTKDIDNWNVVMEYEKEGDGPFLVDLTHKQRFDFQDSSLAKQKPLGIAIPETPGQSVLDKTVIVNRMNNTQASIYNQIGRAHV